jgi:hypothetical protein
MTASRTTPTLCVLVSRIVEPGGAGHFPVAVEIVPGGENAAGELLAARQDRGDAGSHRALADDEFALAADKRDLANLDAGDVRDGVERARRTGKRDT